MPPAVHPHNTLFNNLPAQGTVLRTSAWAAERLSRYHPLPFSCNELSIYNVLSPPYRL